jgi:hypothetical protein
MVKVELYQDSEGVFHYEFRQYKVPRTRTSACGLNTKTLRHAAWFDIGDERRQAPLREGVRDLLWSIGVLMRKRTLAIAGLVLALLAGEEAVVCSEHE